MIFLFRIFLYFFSMAFRLNRFKRSPVKWPFVAELFLPEGLMGFEHCKNCVLIANEQEIPFLWLENKNEALSFIVMDPFLVAPDYDVIITQSDLKNLNIKNEKHLILLVIVNASCSPFTLNLSAPILIDWKGRKGKQILVPASSHYPIFSTMF